MIHNTKPACPNVAVQSSPPLFWSRAPGKDLGKDSGEDPGKDLGKRSGKDLVKDLARMDARQGAEHYTAQADGSLGNDGS